MKQLGGWRSRFALYSLLAAVSLALAGCGGGGSSSSSGSGSLSGSADNTQPVEVNLGPANNYPNGLFTSVTVCVPGSANCQTIPNVLVDTGSYGLRLLSSAVTLSLPAIEDTNNNPLQECVEYGDGSYNWGPVDVADIQMAGEKATSVPLQVIDSSNPTKYAVPSDCTSGGGPNENTVESLGANGILGVGVFQQDCGASCASSAVSGTYYLCPNSVCQSTSVPLADQIQNPVWLFPQDNNGVLISLPSISGTGAQTAMGSMIFGVGTQSDNALGSAQIYTTDPNYGDFQSTYNGIAYTGFIDSGSNALFFLDSGTLGIPDCTDVMGFYCPSSTVDYTVTNTGLNGTTAPVTISIANADSLFNANGGVNAAFDNLGGDSGTSTGSDIVDFGMPFFYGRNVFFGIEGETGPGGVVGPYSAY